MLEIINNKAYDQFRIASYETDCLYEARLNYYFGITQEVAAMHSSAKGLSIASLQEKGLTWVISRTRMEIFHYGRWSDILKTETWAQKCQLFHCPRKIKVTSEDGKPIFTAQTLWAIINQTTGRPIRPNEMIEAQLGLPEESEREDTKLERPLTYENSAKYTISTYCPKIHYFDTDYNLHVNNISYINWINDSLDDSFRDKYKMSLIDCRWLQQTFKADKLIVSVGSEYPDPVESENINLSFKIEKIVGDEKEKVFEATTTWKEHKAFYQ